MKLTTEDTSHILGIMSSMLSTLASETPARIRLLTKFVEKDYEKVERLLEIRNEAQARLKATEKKIAREKQSMAEAEEEITEDEELQWYIQRLDGGLFTLQHTDYILAWTAMEDDGVSTCSETAFEMEAHVDVPDLHARTANALPEQFVSARHHRHIADILRQRRRRRRGVLHTEGHPE